ncbi:hypothetical protein EMIT0P74_160136 [Pseudomonas sp. IT-P74]
MKTLKRLPSVLNKFFDYSMFSELIICDSGIGILWELNGGTTKNFC